MPNNLTIPSHRELFIEQLKQIAPCVFNENQLDIGLLHQHLGFDAERTDIEQYSVNWVGKTKAIRTLRNKTLSLLIPDVGKSLDFHNTENVFIEGDNLETLKILQQSYFGTVDFIYIDPPYNTGNDFVYADKYDDSLQTYLEYAGLMGSSEAFSNESQTGRKHSNWLSMMYPRLVLARNLLSTTGTICISIDENEIANLLKLGAEIYGEENVDIMVWNKISDEGSAGQGKMKNTLRIRQDHEYVVVFYKHKNLTTFNKPLRLKTFKNQYGNADNDARGDWLSCEICKSEEKSNPNGVRFYEVVTPKNITIARQWHLTKDEFDALNKDNRIYWGSGTSIPRLKKFLNEPHPTTPSSVMSGISQTDGNDALKALFPEYNIMLFDNPKPVALVEWLIEIATTDTATILDFFAGSGTTAQAVMKLNYSVSDSKRRYIAIQLDERPNFSNTSEERQKASAFSELGFKTIADLTVERIKRAGKLYAGTDIGYRHFSLPKAMPIKEQALLTVDELKSQVLPVKAYACPEEVITEMLLKKGLRLSVLLENISDTVYKVADGGKIYYLCVETSNVDLTLIKSICAYANAGDEVIFIESAFSLDGKLNAFNLLEQQHGLVVGLI